MNTVRWGANQDVWGWGEEGGGVVVGAGEEYRRGGGGGYFARCGTQGGPKYRVCFFKLRMAMTVRTVQLGKTGDGDEGDPGTEQKNRTKKTR